MDTKGSAIEARVEEDEGEGEGGSAVQHPQKAGQDVDHPLVASLVADLLHQGEVTQIGVHELGIIFNYIVNYFVSEFPC